MIDVESNNEEESSHNEHEDEPVLTNDHSTADLKAKFKRTGWLDEEETETISIIHKGFFTRIEIFFENLKRSWKQTINPRSYLMSQGLTNDEIEQLLMLYPFAIRDYCHVLDVYMAIYKRKQELLAYNQHSQNNSQIGSPRSPRSPQSPRSPRSPRSVPLTERSALNTTFAHTNKHKHDDETIQETLSTVDENNKTKTETETRTNDTKFVDSVDHEYAATQDLMSLFKSEYFISMNDLLGVQYLKYNPFKDRIGQIFTKNLLSKQRQRYIDLDRYDYDENNITFFDFCECLSVFCEDAEPQDKIKFAFQVYDDDADGQISKDNLFRVLKQAIGKSFDDEDINVIVENTFKECQLNSNGEIDFVEFKSVVGVSDIISKLTIHF